MVNTGFSRVYLAAGLLLRSLVPQLRTTVIPARDVTPSGVEYDLYETTIKQDGALLFVYGQTYAGEKDIRVVQFASAHAGSGLRVAVPILPGLKAFNFVMGDLEKLIDLIRTLHRQFGDPIRISGVSVGAGLALVTAAQPELHGIVDLLFLLSPHYSLMDVMRSLHEKPRPDPREIEKWKIFIWHQTILAFHYQDSLDLNEAEREEFEYILQNYATEEARAESFYKEVLSKRDLPSFGEIPVDNATLQALSPKGKLANLPTRVLIFHDPYDERYSSNHSKRLMVELKQ